MFVGRELTPARSLAHRGDATPDAKDARPRPAASGYAPTCTPVLPAATRLKQPEHMEGRARSPNLLGPTCPGMVLWWRRKHPRSEVISVGSGSMTSGTHVTPKHLLHQGNEEPQPFPSGLSRESNELTQTEDQSQEPGGLVPRDERQPLPAGQP